MARLLFTVEDTFLIKGRGLVAVPGIVPQDKEEWRIGDQVLLKRPDGTSLSCQISGLEMICGGPPRDAVAVLLKGLGKDDMPVDTEVWSIDPTEPTAALDQGGR